MRGQNQKESKGKKPKDKQDKNKQTPMKVSN